MTDPFARSVWEAQVRDLKARLQAAEAERIETRDRCFALVAERDAAEARAAAAEDALREVAAEVEALRELGADSPRLVWNDDARRTYADVAKKLARALRGSPGSAK